MFRPLLTFLLVSIVLIAVPQNPADIDDTFIVKDSVFGSGEGFNSGASVSVTQSDNKVIIGGGFTTYNLETQNRIIRLDEYGIKDETFMVGEGFNQAVHSLVLQSDEKIIAGGLFTQYDGHNYSRLTRLNSDGSYDQGFNIGSGFDYEVLSIEVQPDGKIIVAGKFTSFNGSLHRKILRLNSDGSLDTSFVSPSQINGEIKTIALQPDGKIIVGGNFTSFNNENMSKIARLNSNGTLDNSFQIGEGFNTDGYLINAVRVIHILPSGQFLAGGLFSSFDNNTCNSLARINPDGSFDHTFEIGSGFDSWVLSITEEDDNKLIIGGAFSSFNDDKCFGLVRISSGGQLDNSFNIDNDFLNSAVNHSTLLDDGSLIVTGSFSQYPSTGKNRISRLNDDGTVNEMFNPYTGFDRTVFDIQVQSDGRILVGGEFTRFHNTFSPKLIRLSSEGLIDPEFNIGQGFNDQVNTILPLTDGKILVGGNFTSFNNQTQNYIVRLNANGTIDETFQSGEGFNAAVNQFALLPDGKVLVVGAFTQYDGTEAFRILRLNNDGSMDLSFYIENGFNSTVNCIAVQENGALIVGGRFTSFGDISRGRIARLDANGYLDASFNPGTGFDVAVYDLGISQDGKILVGGFFFQYNGISARNLVRLNNDGSIDDTFLFSGSMNWEIYAIVMQEDGKAVIGGTFETSDYKTLFRLLPDGQVDASFDVGNGFIHYRTVFCLTLQQDGKILTGGAFRGYNDIGRKRIARLVGDSIINSIPDGRHLTSGTIYPNPTKGNFTIELDKRCPEINMLISDNLGQTIDTGTFFDTKTISHQIKRASGLYFVTLKYGGLIETYKVIIEP